ncbi:MAG: undecaprenyldiphospho-muramoylpentapeptide beta-N-acetylglucosaminyltransferase [Clostridioides sp.]|jgi:UDP-N-acetylglucosamine--N-acetylmuramyl-(pentapeptide) pyrophosphoryl-undecaprenol N-acetylglucosamine transferase|nr:undecaprenyldiphospho-muramoylpentapeptide beta-N-acetylglucosaminyltransferase [Clostridioides sp.]
MKVVLSGGGTGGHIYPAVAIANKIKDEYKDAEILFIGTKTGMESEIVPKSGFDLKTVTVQGFNRKNKIKNIDVAFKLCKGLEETRRVLKKFKPDVVIGTGGYVSGPVLFNASIRKIPTIIHEQNSFPGVTNKILSRTVTKVLTSFEDSHKRFPKDVQAKLKYVGNPVRKEIIDANKVISRKKLGIPNDKKMVLCYGGSGGAKKLNDAMKIVIRNMISEDVAFIFATGKRFYDEFMESMVGINFKPYQTIVPYLDDMANALAASDVVIGSAGAITIAELTVLGKPSILIPKAYTAENHQEYNARSIEKRGAGICILEKNLNANKLNKELFDLLDDKNRLQEMSYASKNIGKPESIDLIFDEVVKIVNKKNESKLIKAKKKEEKKLNKNSSKVNKTSDKDNMNICKNENKEKENSYSQGSTVKSIGIKKR